MLWYDVNCEPVSFIYITLSDRIKYIRKRTSPVKDMNYNCQVAMRKEKNCQNLLYAWSYFVIIAN